MITQLAIDDFVAAWNESEGSSFSQKAERQSLVAIARREPDLRPVLAELKGGARQHLDMRLTGKHVDEHWAPADMIGDFFKNVAEAVKELAKGISGKPKWSSNLVTAAPAPGSLKLSFATDSSARQLTLDEQNLGTADDQALVKLGQLFAAAAADSDSLPAAAASMHNDAAISVRRVTEMLLHQEWSVDFNIYGPFHTSAPFKLDAHSSQALLSTLQVERKTTSPVTIRGVLDGWKWSEGSLYLVPNAGKKFSAAVPVSLQHEVAHLAANKGIQIEARFNRIVVNNLNQKRAKRTLYELVSINEVTAADSQ